MAASHVDWLYRGPLVSVRRWSCAKGGPDHRPETFEVLPTLGWVSSKGFALRCARGAVFVDSNTLVLLNAGECYETSHPVGTGDRGGAVHLAPELVQDILRSVSAGSGDSARPFAPLTIPCTPRSFFRLSLLLGEASSMSSELALEEAALAVAAEVVPSAPPCRPRSGASRGSSSCGSPIADEVRVLLQAALDEPWHLTALSQKLRMAPYRLWRSFRRETGTSIHRYQTSLRLRAALARLAEGEADLSRLAFELGFSSHSHFGASFLKEFRVRPSQARSMIRTRAAALPSLAARSHYRGERGNAGADLGQARASVPQH